MKAKREVIAPQLKKSDWLLIASCWLGVQLILLFYLGINTKEESIKYINLAQSWIHGGLPFHWSQIFYSGYISTHMLLNLAGLPPKSMYIVQLAFSGFAVMYFVKTIGLYTSSRPMLIFSGLVLSTCFFIQQWVTALFTDSLFTSLVIIASYYLLSESRSIRNQILCWVLLLLLPTFRPVGLLFPLLACLYWLWIAEKRQVQKSLICMIYLVVIGVFIKMALVNNPGFFYPNHNVEANIICGYPSSLLKFQRVAYDEHMGVTAYLLNNPAMTFRLFSSRFIKVFSLTRDYFSPVHNAVLTGFTLIYLILAVSGSLFLWKHHKSLLAFIVTAILIFSVPSVIFCVEWAGRFSLPVYGFVLLLCSFGIEPLLPWSEKPPS